MRATTLKNTMLRAAVTARHPELLRGRRGLSMLEYALMALIVLAMFGLLVVFFPGFIDGITQRIEDLFGQKAPTNI